MFGHRSIPVTCPGSAEAPRKGLNGPRPATTMLGYIYWTERVHGYLKAAVFTSQKNPSFLHNFTQARTDYRATKGVAEVGQSHG
jgi:hypothetical protein